MNAGLKAFSAYKETNAATAIMDATPHQLTGLLLKAATDKLSIAMGAMDRGDITLRTESIRGATAIIIELKSTLNLSEGGEIAAQLDRLYEFSLASLIEANGHCDVSKLQAVRDILSEINEAWTGIAPNRSGA